MTAETDRNSCPLKKPANQGPVTVSVNPRPSHAPLEAAHTTRDPQVAQSIRRPVISYP